MQNVKEIDGPKEASITTPDGREMPYVTYAWVAPDIVDATQRGEDTINEIRDLLAERGGGVIVWRKKPSIERHNSTHYLWRCRLLTVPSVLE